MCFYVLGVNVSRYVCVLFLNSIHEIILLSAFYVSTDNGIT